MTASRLYLKLLDDRYGPQMPLDGPLKPEQINLIKVRYSLLGNRINLHLALGGGFDVSPAASP